LGLFILACGWKFYKDWRLTRFAALANSGHPQYFAAAIAAAYLFCLAICLHRAALQAPFYSEMIRSGIGPIPLFVDPSKGESSANVAVLTALAFWTFVLSVFMGWILNRPLFKTPELLVAVAKKVGAVDQLERLFISCLDEGLLVAVTLSSKKVYVGVGERSSGFHHDRNWVSIWPWASGYRDDTGRLNITTYYEPQYIKLDGVVADGLTPDDFLVVVPRSEIVSAQSIDLPTFQIFSDQDAPDAASAALNSKVTSGANGKEGSLVSGPTADIKLLTNEIVSTADRYRLAWYWVYVVLVSTAIASTPHSLIVSAFAAALARIASHEAAFVDD
jgi:hypothetical protein